MSVPGVCSPRLTAAEVMTHNPRTCSTFSTVLEAVLIFRDADCGAVPIVENDKPVGILTDRDVALALADEPELASRPVVEIMTPGVVTVPPETPLDVVRDKFADKAVRRLLVVDARDRLLGIIAWADIADMLSQRALGQMVAEVVDHP